VGEVWLQGFLTAFEKLWAYTGHHLREPSLSSPFVIVAGVSALCLLFELIGPQKQPGPVFKRPGFVQDLGYVVWMDLIVFPIGLYAVLAATGGVVAALLQGWGLPAEPAWAVSRLPAPAALIATLVLIDFAEWVGHYALHRVPLLWRFHRIHHAQPTLGFGSTRHFHFGEHVVFRSAVFVPVAFLGVSAEQYAAVAWVQTFLAFLSHSNVKFDLGRLHRWIITPDNHYWHHAKTCPRPYGVNFGSYLMVWDHLFGTFHLPEGEEPDLGLLDDDIPPGFLAQQIYPFRPRRCG
jgi:sterol desaturase/sphingolipid hydroxylase (fatty acid hydroxylase superfamily)